MEEGREGGQETLFRVEKQGEREKGRGLGAVGNAR